MWDNYVSTELTGQWEGHHLALMPSNGKSFSG